MVVINQTLINLKPFYGMLRPRAHHLIEQIPGHYERKDLGGFCRCVAALEQHMRDFTKLVPLYQSVASLAFELNDYAGVTEFAIKTMLFGRDEAIESATGFIERVCVAFPQLAVHNQNRIRDLMAGYLRKAENISSILRLPVKLKISWTISINCFFPKKFLPEQLELTEQVFNQSTEDFIKYQCAASYSLIARRLVSIDRKPVSAEKVRRLCGYVLDNFSGMLADREKWDDEQFDTWIADLACFGMFDLIELAMRARQVREDEAVSLYVKLLFLMRDDIEKAFQTSMDLEKEISEKEKSPTLASEFQLLGVKISRRFFECIKAPFDEMQEGLEAATYFEKVLLRPIGENPALQKALADLRAKLLKVFESYVTTGQYFMFTDGISGVLGDAVYHASFISDVGRSSAEAYIVKQGDSKALRLKFPFRFSAEGKVTGINSEVVFDKAGKKHNQPALLWEYLITLLLCKNAEAESLFNPKELDDINLRVNALGSRLLLADNAARFEEFAKEFAQDEECADRKLEMENCLRMAEAIFNSFIPEIRPFTYRLCQEDFLSELIESISVLEAQDFSVNGGQAKYPIPIMLKTMYGEEIQAAIKSPKEVVVPGSNAAINKLLEKYILELIFAASAKAFTDFSRTEPGSGQGAIIFGEDDELVTDPEQILRAIYQKEFLKLVGQRGLFAFPWFYVEPAGRDDVLFYSFEGQSIERKRQLLEDRGAGGIFVQIEPFGSIRVLPVSRRKKRDGSFDFRPKNRKPVRKQQKELLADNSPLSTFYRLYIKTTFSDAEGNEVVQIITPDAMREDENEIWSDALFGKLDKEIRTGIHAANPLKLLKGSSGEHRRKLEARIKSGELTIFDQEIEVFKINTTYHRPQMVRLKDLLGQGYELERG